jgi:hypothetical protein
MVVMRQIQTNFSSGELNPLMRFRSDTGAYQNGAARLRNIALLNTGGVTRRPGTTHLAALPARCRLVAFDFDDNERYVFALSAGRLTVYGTDGALVATVTSGAGWTANELFELTYTQVGDTMIVAHQSLSPKVIRRTGASTFTISNFTFDESVNGNITYQPYYKFADDAVTLACSATTGSVTVTASAPSFTSDYVGVRLRWQDVEIAITGYTNSTTLTGTIKGTLKAEYDIDPFRTSIGSSTVEVTHVLHGFATGSTVIISGANAVGGIDAASLNGSRVITVVDDNRYTFVADAAATESIDGGGPAVFYTSSSTATRTWYEPVFATPNGWPAAVAFHDGRLWFGGTTAQPDGLYGSTINQYFNFDVGEGLDNQAVQVSIGSEDISNIQHIVSNRDLQIFTATSEFIAPRSNAQVLTPANTRVIRQTPYGCNSVTPIPFDGGTLFVQNSGKAVREFVYADAENSYASTDLSLLASHLIVNPRDLAVLYGSASRNEQYAAIVNSDGTLAIFHSARAEQLAGWALWSMDDATFDSVCAVNNALYVSVLRDGTYSLERFAADDSLTLDSSATYTAGSATASWTVASRFNNQEVFVFGDGQYLGPYTVNGSSLLTLDDSYSSITIGYDYTTEIKTLPVNVMLANGSMIGLPKRINRVFLGLDTTLGVSVQGNSLILRGVTDDFSLGISAFTGIQPFYLLGYNREPQVTVTQSEPLAMRVLGMNMEVAF